MTLDKTSVRRCVHCRQILPLTEFRQHPRGWCKLCARAKERAERQMSPEKRAAKRRRTRYGITDAEYQQLRARSSGRCAICRDHTDSLVIDHAHDSSNVRGLLCSKCNRGLGLLRDSPEILLNAYYYLRNPPKIFKN